MEGFGKALMSRTLVPANPVTTVALRQPPEETKKTNRKVLDEENYIEVTLTLWNRQLS